MWSQRSNVYCLSLNTSKRQGTHNLGEPPSHLWKMLSYIGLKSILVLLVFFFGFLVATLLIHTKQIFCYSLPSSWSFFTDTDVVSYLLYFIPVREVPWMQVYSYVYYMFPDEFFVWRLTDTSNFWGSYVLPIPWSMSQMA